jgi:hypothetical protein
MRDVFISYATEDRSTAEAACAALEASGLRCWIAPRDIHPGSVWGEAIVHGISQCTAFVLIFSDAANRSQHVPRELECAVDRNMPIIPFRVDPVMPSKSLSYFIGSAQWLEAQPPPVEQYLDALEAAVRYQLTPVTTRETKAPAQTPSGATGRWRWKLVTIGLVACLLAVGAARVLHWSVPGFGRGEPGTAEPGRAASLAACGSAYGARRWSDALAHCVDVAAAGNLAAQRLVAAIYWRGLGVARNPSRGAAWLQHAAHQGDEEARTRLRKAFGDSAALIPPTRPYLVNEVLELVASGARPQVILSLAHESCVRFSLDSAAAERLLAADASSDLVVGLGSVCHVPTRGEAPPISIAQLDTLVRRRSQAQADSARTPIALPFAGTRAWLALEKAWVSLLAWGASVTPPPAPKARTTHVPHNRAPAAATTPAATTPAATAPPATAPAVTSPATSTAPTPPTGEPAPEQKGTGSLLDAAKQGAQEAAKEEARRKAAEGVKKIFNLR